MEQNEKLQKAIRDKNADRAFLEELGNELESELADPEADSEKISEITDTIGMILDEIEPEKEACPQDDRYYADFLARLHGKRRRKIKWLKKAAVACASVAVVFLSARSLILRASGSNYSDVFEFTPGGVDMVYTAEDFGPTPIIEQSGDPYGILAQCKELGISPLVPTYLPDGYELELVSSHDNVSSTGCDFVCVKGIIKHNWKRIVSVSYEAFHFDNGLGPVTWGISSDEQYAYQETICGYTVNFMIEEKDKQYDAWFIYNGVLCHLSCQKIQPEEFRKTLESMFE